MTAGSIATRIAACNEMIELNVPVDTMINARIGRRSAVDVEAIDELEQGIRWRISFDGGPQMLHG